MESAVNRETQMARVVRGLRRRALGRSYLPWRGVELRPAGRQVRGTRRRNRLGARAPGHLVCPLAVLLAQLPPFPVWRRVCRHSDRISLRRGKLAGQTGVGESQASVGSQTRKVQYQGTLAAAGAGRT